MKVRIKHLFAIVVCLTMALTFSMQNKVFALDAGWQDGDPLSVRFVYDDNAGPYAGQETMHYTIVRSQQKKFMESQITGYSSFQDTDGAKYTMSGIVWQSNNTSVDYSKYYSYNDLKALSDGHGTVTGLVKYSKEPAQAPIQVVGIYDAAALQGQEVSLYQSQPGSSKARKGIENLAEVDDGRQKYTKFNVDNDFYTYKTMVWADTQTEVESNVDYQTVAQHANNGVAKILIQFHVVHYCDYTLNGIDNISTGSFHWSDKENAATVTNYTQTFSDPSKGTPKDDYQFLYWELNGKKYKEGDTYTKDLTTLTEDTTEEAHAWWQPAIKLYVYDVDRKAELGHAKSFDQLTLADALKEEPSMKGRKFTGFVDENGNKVDIDTVFKAPEAGYENIQPKTVNLYATYSYTITYKTNGGVWKDGSDKNKNETHDVTEGTKILEAPKKEGYTFKEWKGSSSYQPGDAYSEKAKDGYYISDTLEAVWEKNPATANDSSSKTKNSANTTSKKDSSSSKETKSVRTAANINILSYTITVLASLILFVLILKFRTLQD